MNSFARDAKPPPNSPARPSSSRANMRFEAPAAAGAGVGPVEGEVEEDEPDGEVTLGTAGPAPAAWAGGTAPAAGAICGGGTAPEPVLGFAFAFVGSKFAPGMPAGPTNGGDAPGVEGLAAPPSSFWMIACSCGGMLSGPTTLTSLLTMFSRTSVTRGSRRPVSHDVDAMGIVDSQSYSPRVCFCEETDTGRGVEGATLPCAGGTAPGAPLAPPTEGGAAPAGPAPSNCWRSDCRLAGTAAGPAMLVILLTTPSRTLATVR